MEKEKLKILEELRRILNNKNEAIIILNSSACLVSITALADELSVAFLSGSLWAVQPTIAKMTVNIIVNITIFLIQKSPRYSQCPLLYCGCYSSSAPIV